MAIDLLDITAVATPFTLRTAAPAPATGGGWLPPMRVIIVPGPRRDAVAAVPSLRLRLTQPAPEALAEVNAPPPLTPAARRGYVQAHMAALIDPERPAPAVETEEHKRLVSIARTNVAILGLLDVADAAKDKDGFLARRNALLVQL